MKIRMMFLVVVFCVSLVSTASAAPWAGQGHGPSQPASVSGSPSGGRALAEAVHWVLRLWVMATESLPTPPGITNGSCVDPDGSTCRAHG
jgi:hypothetical protein